MGLPFLTLPDHLVSGEGALDPLGLSAIADRIADEILPGLRARMSRPRFLTAIAVSAAICEGLEERLAADNVTPAYLIFEWLVVEAFVRTGDRDATKGTPGTQKVQAARASGEPICARTYLRTPTIFGFHGVYRPLARNLGIVDDDLRLGDNGYELLKVWRTEQGLEGFLESSVVDGRGRSVRKMLRDAVEVGLGQGYVHRSGSWQGWSLLAERLSPGRTGPNEAALLLRLLSDAACPARSEVFRLLLGAPDEDLPEHLVTRDLLLPQASAELRKRLLAISAYEEFCGILEGTFEWIRYLSTRAGARPIHRTDFASEQASVALAEELPGAMRGAESALSCASLAIQQQFVQLAKSFDAVRDPATLFEAILEHHAQVQSAKQPDGKRPWFERSGEGATLVRVPYRLSKRPETLGVWGRPYRISAVRSFLTDVNGGAHGGA